VGSVRTYFQGNRIWWSVALFAGPVVAAVTRDIFLGLVAVSVLVLPSFVLFDTDRPWWPDAVRRLPQDPVRTRSETRKLTLWAGIALVAGLAIAFARPWA
jgi:hypothetical protein